MSQTFTSVDDRVLREVITQARQRLVFIAPGLRPPVAEVQGGKSLLAGTNDFEVVAFLVLIPNQIR